MLHTTCIADNSYYEMNNESRYIDSGLKFSLLLLFGPNFLKKHKFFNIFSLFPKIDFFRGYETWMLEVS